ncbi:AAA family ATPase [uncultured Nocardioides sp.]|uniref:AAA family ATPase n=1 Tax=uncultured Nocardioides sp. TaxID=198441 RepID=UPI00261C5F3C|nr:AAA family ATPase [uncultured Nocardioides sp.]
MDFDQPPVRRFAVRDDDGIDREEWPATVPAVAQVLREGFTPAKGVTMLVGENGSGKSTLVEGLAEAFGLSPEGGTPYGHHSTRRSESPLGRALRVERGLGTGRYGFFLRAETMHSWYTFLEDHPPLDHSRSREPRYHEMSHGESFLAVLRTRFDSPGFYCLDEPEAALSFSSTLGLVGALADLVADGGQAVCATHSPVLAAMPGVRLLEVGEWGLREAAWEDLELVRHWKAYLDAPMRYLRHVLDQ